MQSKKEVKVLIEVNRLMKAKLNANTDVMKTQFENFTARDRELRHQNNQLESRNTFLGITLVVMFCLNLAALIIHFK